MIDSSQSYVQQVVAHVIGNKGNGEDIVMARDVLDISDESLSELMKIYFLSHFSTPEFYTFTFSNEDFTLNPIYRFVEAIFEDPETFYQHSTFIAQHLHEATQHPNIKSGDLYIAYISNVVIENSVTDAIGIFKSENKEKYIKLKKSSRSFSVSADEGTNVKKLDKGCLIFNIEREAGFKMCLVDNANSVDAQFWKKDFLNVKPWSDAFQHTKNFLGLTQEYLSDKMKEEFKVTKADQIDLQNRSVDYFKTHDQFDQREFEMDVLGDANVIESFRKFGDTYREQSNQDAMDSFEISVHAVKRQARIFKNILKLDKNFHVYIHGNNDLIERGYDEVMGKNYYKFYFDNES